MAEDLNVRVQPTPINPIEIKGAIAFSAEHARIWAEGTDGEVEQLGGEHSAKGWSQITGEESKEYTDQQIAIARSEITTQINTAVDGAVSTAKTYADNAVEQEASNREISESLLQNNIDNEESARIAADNNLQGQIDAISAASDVTDIVGTYAELQAYDTSKLKDNDIIKVLTDSTHDNASTYYRWDKDTSAFSYIGAEGPYYTKAETDAKFLTQVDAASTYVSNTDLSTALSGKANNADGTTIVDNGSTISTVAVKEQNNSLAIKEWVGTQAQYEAITTKDTNTLYTITDEDDVQPIIVDSAISPTSTNPVQNKAIYDALATKQSTLTEGAGITLDGNEINANADYSDFLIPDTTNMKVLKTFNYTVSSSSDYYTFATLLNNISLPTDFRLSTLFRMTITGEGINSVVECMISTLGLIGDGAYIIARNTQDSFTAGASGLRYIRMLSPKAANNGYNYAFELFIFNNVARNIKLEVLKDDSRINWLNSLTATTYDSTYQNATSLTIYTSKGVIVTGTPNMTVSGANSAGSITNNLPKGLGTQPSAGEALITGLVYASGGKLYQGSNTTMPIDADFGVQFSSAANVALNSAPGVSSFRQKTAAGLSSLGVSSDAVVNGDGMYLRCTMSGGQIYSDNYISKTPSAGYTWYYLGYASNNANINLDTTQSFFFTLDANGKLTYVNGRQINGGVPTLTWYTGNTGNTVTISNTSGAGLVKVYKNGILQEPTADYSISGTTLTMVTALVAADKITTEVF